MPTSPPFVIAQILERELARNLRLGPGFLDADESDAIASAIEDAILRGATEVVPQEGKRPQELTSDNDG